MNQTSPTDDLRTGPLEDNLDRVLSEFFKSQMKHPWPAAPATTARVTPSEPSVLVTARNTATTTPEVPRNQPTTASASRDGSGKARYTLAASVAVLIGTCWYLSNGFQPLERVGPTANPAQKVLGVLPDTNAEKPAPLTELRKENAEKGNKGFTPPKMLP